jgi:hypothetical protein
METRYGRWTLIDPTETGGFVHVRCDCGTERRVQRSRLINGTSKSCGCRRRDRLLGKTWPNLAPDHATEVVPGARFGRWTVTGEIQPGHNRQAPCRCDCGTERNVVAAHLLSGRARSCGCLRRDAARAIHQKDTPT